MKLSPLRKIAETATGVPRQGGDDPQGNGLQLYGGGRMFVSFAFVCVHEPNDLSPSSLIILLNFRTGQGAFCP